MPIRDVLTLLVLAALWGASFLFIKLAAPSIGPFALAFSRVLLAGLALLAFARVVGEQAQFRFRWKIFLTLGALNAALPFALVAFAAPRLGASLAAMLNAVTPLLTALVAFAWLREGLSAARLAGLALGIAGVGLVVGGSIAVSGAGWWLAVGASLLASLAYAVAGVYAKRAPATPPLGLALGQQWGAALVLLPFAVLDAPRTVPSFSVVWAVLALALPCTAVAYVLFFQLVARTGPVGALSVTLLVPVFGVLWGVLFLGEMIGPVQVLGLVVVLASVALTNRTSGRVLKRA